MTEAYPFIIKFHVIFSTIFLLTALWVSVQSLIKFIINKEYTPFDDRLSRSYLILLYADLIMGLLLYFVLKRPESGMDIHEAQKYLNIRFWAVMHVSIMAFVTILSQIGRILAKSTSISKKKFKYAFLYYGTSTALTVGSVGWYLFNK